jgi:hypothetical protein
MAMQGVSAWVLDQMLAPKGTSAVACGLARLLLGQLRGSQLAKLFLHQWQQLLGRTGIALLNLGEYLLNVSHNDQNNAAKQVIPSAMELDRGFAQIWAG